jgi:hypothetical protein
VSIFMLMEWFLRAADEGLGVVCIPRCSFI